MLVATDGNDEYDERDTAALGVLRELGPRTAPERS